MEGVAGVVARRADALRKGWVRATKARGIRVTGGGRTVRQAWWLCVVCKGEEEWTDPFLGETHFVQRVEVCLHAADNNSINVMAVVGQ